MLETDLFPDLTFLVGAFSFKEKSPTITVASFLVGAFSLKEKSPTITVASFFSFFFVRPQSSSRMYHFLQKLISSLRPSSTNANLLQRAPFRFLPFLRNIQNRKTPKGPPFHLFFGTVRFFFRKFLMSQKSPPSDFLIFCNRKYVNESQRVPLFIFRHYATFSKFFFKKFFFKNFFFKIFKFFFVSSRETVIFQSYRA